MRKPAGISAGVSHGRFLLSWGRVFRGVAFQGAGVSRRGWCFSSAKLPQIQQATKSDAPHTAKSVKGKGFSLKYETRHSPLVLGYTGLSMVVLDYPGGTPGLARG